MVETNATLIAIAMMALILYLTRITGYFIGLQLRHIRGIQPVLEALPGCAFMAILAPAVRQGSISEVIAMTCVVLIMWRSNNVVLATGTGMAVLLLDGPYLDTG
ncbi:MAG: AzlD domain-containing protein [Gammaproteobacteria bacterium]|nr:AzlD domain-containing protein [Gammaproteobacteria bacterium]